MKDMRDAIDYGTMRIPLLFRKLFFPTLLGLISSVLLNLADGIFVGRGVGSAGGTADHRQQKQGGKDPDQDFFLHCLPPNVGW